MAGLCGVALTIKQLAKLIGVTERSIKRYESNQSTPDTHSIKQLACIFDLSTDYLLALSNNADTSFLDEYRTNNIYYKKVLNNSPILDEDYFWVEHDPAKEPYPMRGQMWWAGINNEGKELYCLRPINVETCIKIFAREVLPGRKNPLIVNTLEDFKEALRHLLRPGTITDNRL